MHDLADLYPGYASHWIDTSAGKIFARTGGNGPPLLLLHGYAQTNVMWHAVAPSLAEHFSLVIADLPGYGWSAVPESGEGHAPYDKRSMGNAMVELMEKLGHARFRLAGHDRGGRVAYRLALDHPGRLERLATLDIVPTHTMWHSIDAQFAFRICHWTFLELPARFPEEMIGRDLPTLEKVNIDGSFHDWCLCKHLQREAKLAIDPAGPQRERGPPPREIASQR